MKTIRFFPLLPIPLAAGALWLAACSPKHEAAGEPDNPASEAARGPAGEDPKWSTKRERMVRQQLTSGDRNIRSQRVLDAMGKVPRHQFVPASQQTFAYDDRPLPIGHGQTISQPYVVAFMTEALDPQPGDRVLEIGTGSGYQAAILAELVKEVWTIEIVEPLGKTAEAALKAEGYDNVHVRIGDGYAGLPDEAPFDSIIVTCAPDHVPPALIGQLKDGGRMMIPVGPEGGVQELVLLRKRGDEIERESVLPVRFVPMTGKARGD